MRNDSEVSRERIIEEIERLSESLGKTPGRRDFPRETGIPMRCVLDHFDTWNEAVEAAGLMPRVTRANPSKLIADWGNVARQLGAIPTLLQYKKLANFNSRTLERNFTRWLELPEVFRQWARGKPEWSDVVALLPTEKSVSCNELAAHDPEDRSSLPEGQRYSHLSNRATYGNPTDFRGLRHEPVNEQGVVFLFGMVARELGYMVEVIQSGFPDCEAKRQVAPGKWQRVFIEFEYESRHFREHGHPTAGCDVIICWIDNWPECPDSMEVLELRSTIRRLGSAAD